MDQDNLPNNLRSLCGHYRSVAEVCRLIGINRQQFNKYLSGVSQPSLRTLRRICDFFGIDESEMFLPTADFAALTKLRGEARTKASPLAACIEAITGHHAQSREKLQRYCGYYAGFIRSPAFPREIFRTLTVIFQGGDHCFAKTIERPVSRGPAGIGALVSKNLGLVLHGDDRIYLWDHNPHFYQSFSLTVLYPSYRARPHLLTGLGLSISDSPGRQAFATRCVLEYLGTSIDRRAAIAACGFYPEDSREIDPAVRSRLHNEIGAEEGTLCALGY